MLKTYWRPAVCGCIAGIVNGLLGAGGGGFLVFYVEKEQQAAVRAALSELLYVPFRFENDGTRVIHHTGEPQAQNGETERRKRY